MDKPTTILEFADFLGIKLYDWQAKIVLAIDSNANKERVKLAVRAPNEAGKTTRINVLSALWWMFKYNGKVVVTSKDNRQISDQFWPALRRLTHKFPTWKVVDSEYTVVTPEGARLRAFTTKDPGRAEGFHHDESTPLIVIVDEAKSIDEVIFESVDRCSYNVLLYISSPLTKEGRFYDAFQSDQFMHFHAGLADCPHISKERIKDTIAWYGENDPFTKSTLYGEFMDYGEGIKHVIELSDLERWREATPGKVQGAQVFGLDFARGGDENVLVHVCGNFIADNGIIAWRDMDSSAAVYRFVAELRDRGYDSKNKFMTVIGDATGIGGPMCDMLRRNGIEVVEFNFGGHTDDKHFKNEGSRIWYQVCQKICDFKIVAPPYHQPIVKRLFSQLASRRQRIDETNGKLSMECKDDMKACGIASPDLADAFCMAFGMLQAEQRSYLPFDDTNRQEIARRKGWEYTPDDSYDDRSNRPGSDDDRRPFWDSTQW
jgi:phage terminase large subunit